MGTLQMILAGGIAGLLVWLWVDHGRIETLKASNQTLTHDLDQAKSANKGLLDTVDAQKLALIKWQGIAAAGAKDAQEASEAATTAKDSRDSLEKTLHDLESKDAGKVGCDAILDTDLAAVCPAHAQAIRQRAQ